MLGRACCRQGCARFCQQQGRQARVALGILSLPQVPYRPSFDFFSISACWHARLRLSIHAFNHSPVTPSVVTGVHSFVESLRETSSKGITNVSFRDRGSCVPKSHASHPQGRSARQVQGGSVGNARRHDAIQGCVRASVKDQAPYARPQQASCPPRRYQGQFAACMGLLRHLSCSLAKPPQSLAAPSH